MLMYILNANLILKKSVGDISASKFNEIRAIFRDFPEVSTENGQLVFRKGLNLLAVQGNQIVYATQGNVEDVNISNAVEYLTRLTNALDSPTVNPFAMNFEILDQYDYNTMEKSRAILQEVSDSIDAAGLGFRFILNPNPDFFGEIRIEPYINETTQAYYQVTLQTQKNIDIVDSHDLINRMFEHGIDIARKASEKLYR